MPTSSRSGKGPKDLARYQRLVDLGALNQNLGCSVEVIDRYKRTFMGWYLTCWVCGKKIESGTTVRTINLKWSQEEYSKIDTCWNINACEDRASAQAFQRATST